MKGTPSGKPPLRLSAVLEAKLPSEFRSCSCNVAITVIPREFSEHETAEVRPAHLSRMRRRQFLLLANAFQMGIWLLTSTAILLRTEKKTVGARDRVHGFPPNDGDLRSSSKRKFSFAVNPQARLLILLKR
jgi:hypothetical protein